MASEISYDVKWRCGAWKNRTQGDPAIRKASLDLIIIIIILCLIDRDFLNAVEEATVEQA